MRQSLGRTCRRCGEDQWSSRTGRAPVCAVCHVQRVNENRRRRIDEAIVQYGGRCADCGESDREALTFDHVNDDGADHRRMIGRSAWQLVCWAKRNGWPDTLQVLCANCQLRKQRRRGGVGAITAPASRTGLTRRQGTWLDSPGGARRPEGEEP